MLGFDADGDGEHSFLWVEKRDTNTEWLARQLARHAGVPLRDVGYSGLKDRHALTRQWYSVIDGGATNWHQFQCDGVRLLICTRHRRKLRRGSHRANDFRIVLRADDMATQVPALLARAARIESAGVPNYFGEQRFGRDAGNLALADQWAAGNRLPRAGRSRAISTARAWLFNDYLAQRVAAGTWNRIVDGDIVNLDGSGSIFEADPDDPALAARAARMDVHPAGILAGEHSAVAGTATQHPEWLRAFERDRVREGTRALRIRVENLQIEPASEAVSIAFRLRRGAYATAVLRELVRWGPQV